MKTGLILLLTGVSTLILSACQTFLPVMHAGLIPARAADPTCNEIVAIGSSGVRGFGCYAPEYQSWPSIVARYLWTENTGYEVFNAGVNGESTIAIAARLDGLLKRPAAVFVLDVGEADIDLADKPGGIFPDLAPIKERIRAIAHRILDSGHHLILMRPNYPEFDDYMAQFTRMYIDLGKELGVPVIDMMPPQVFWRLDTHYRDGHFNEVGHLEIAQYILKQLNPAFQATLDDLRVPNEAIRQSPWIEYVLANPGRLGLD